MSYNEGINNRLLTYFRNRYKVKPSTKGWFRCNCPFCSGKYSFGINIQYDRAKCHKCDYNKSLLRTVSELEGKETSSDTLTFIEENFDETNISLFNKIKINKTELKLPESFRLISFGDGFAGKSARSYMKNKRGLSISYLTYRGVGYCDAGKYEGCIIFPLYWDNKLVYFTDRRYLMGLGNGRKFTNLTEEEVGIGKSKMIYNRDALYIYKKIYLVESVINALTMGDRGVALFGKSASSFQKSEIIRSPVEDIVILLDPDAILQAINLAIELSYYKRVKLIFWKGTDDVNKMGRIKTQSIIKQFKWQSTKELMSIKYTYENEKGAIYTR